MKIFYKHLLRFLIDKPSIEDISDKLFQLGHENEIYGEIIDIEFTPNRGDCLSLKGLARDLGAFYKINTFLEISNGAINSLDITFNNHSPKDCPRISFLNIEIDGKVKKYEPYLESYFTDLDIKKNNFFTDISNYLAYEIGQPTHCYDFSKLGQSLDFKNLETNEKFITITDQSIELSGHNCVFFSDNKIINLAGVMGGKSTCCEDSTTNVLIECAYFNPESIIGKSVKYDLQSDAAYKFERGVDPELHDLALKRFLKIVLDHAKVKNSGIFSQDCKNVSPQHLDLDAALISRILGTEISEDFYIDTLKKLGFKCINKFVEIPSHRHDISHQNDLAEEVARVIGYNNIKSKEFKFNLKEFSNLAAPHSFFTSKEEALKQFLIDRGFNEVINMPFSDHNHKEAINIDNPIDSNKRFLRTNIEDSLIENLTFNENRQKDSIKLFEISDIYISNPKIKNIKKLGLIISGRVGFNYQDFSKNLDKKYIINIFKPLNMILNQEAIKQIDRKDIKSKSKNNIFVLEIDFDDIPDSILNYSKEKPNTDTFGTKYIPTSELPSSTRDISFIVSDPILISELEKLLLHHKTKNLKDVFVFDFYENKKINKIKIGFRFIFQSNKSTLTVKEVDLEMQELISLTKKFSGVEIPGLT
tara:strand:+ start:2932 stop:4866 length:1935 start_codon:yes stop_codon:yes gene_type:complete